MNMTDTMADKADTAAAKAKPVLDRISSIASEAADRAYEMKGQAKDYLASHADQLSAKQKQVLDDASNYISSNPFKAIGIAIVAALVVGRLMK